MLGQDNTTSGQRILSFNPSIAKVEVVASHRVSGAANIPSRKFFIGFTVCDGLPF